MTDPVGGSGSEDNVDVLLLTAIDLEYTAARDSAKLGYLDHPGVVQWHDRDADRRSPYVRGTFKLANGDSFDVALARQTAMGGDYAAAMLGELIPRLRPNCLAMSGVCAGKPGSVALGDVVIAENSYLFLEGKATPELFLPNPRPHSMSELWHRAAQGLSPEDLDHYQVPSAKDRTRWFLERLTFGEDLMKHPARGRYFVGDAWREAIDELKAAGLIRRSGAVPRVTSAGREWLIRAAWDDPDWPRHLPFAVHVAPMASGPFVAANDPWAFLEGNGPRSVLGVDMEAAAVASAAHRTATGNWLVVKGVMDPATPAKDDRYKSIAAWASAEVLWKFLVHCRQHLPDTIVGSGSATRMSEPERSPLDSRSRNIVLPDSNVPAPPSALIGRDELRASCSEMLTGGARLVSLLGPPGTGKTRVAIALADSLRDVFGGHVYFVDLTSIADPDLVIASITQSLRIKAADPLIEALKELFRGNPALIVLDNFEQVVAAAPRVRELLTAIPELSVLVTSRSPLRLSFESEVDVPPLPLADAMTLFENASGSARVSRESHEAMARLCNLVDCLPLAVELIGARARYFAPEELARRLDPADHSGEADHFSRVLTLQNDRADAVERQISLEAAIAWSFGILSESERRLFIRLSIFQGGWTLESATAVLGPGQSVEELEDVTISLLQSRLIIKDEERDGKSRFRMYLSLREFGLSRLHQEEGLFDTLRFHHAEHFLAFAECVAEDLAGAERASALDQLAADNENLNAALACLTEKQAVLPALRLARALGDYWWSRNYSEGYRQLKAVLDMEFPAEATDDDLELRCAVQIVRGKLAIRQFQLGDAEVTLLAALGTARGIGDRALESRALATLALVRVDQGLYEEARGELVAALGLAEDLGDVEDQADCLDVLGTLAVEAGEYQSADILFARSIALYEALGSAVGVAWVRHDMAELMLLKRDYEKAKEYADSASGVGRDESDLGLRTWAAHYLGYVELAIGETDRAREYFGESLTATLILGDVRPRLRALEGIAVVAARRGNSAASVTLAEALLQLRGLLQLPRSPAEIELMHPAIALATASLDQASLAAAVRAGQRMNLDQATELARTL